MKWILFFLFFFAVTAFFGFLYLFAPGNVTITWLNYEIQFSVVGAFISFVFLLLIIFLLSKMIYYFFSFIVHCFSFSQKSKDKVEHTQHLPPSFH